jgi:hypothetical protein
MLSILVAMFTETYLAVQANAKIEYNFLRCQRVTDLHSVVLRAPPPLSAPFILVDMLFYMCERIRGGCTGRATVTSRRQTQDAAIVDMESVAHRLIELHLAAEEETQASSTDGMLSEAKDILTREATEASTRFAKLIDMTAGIQSEVVRSTKCAAGEPPTRSAQREVPNVPSFAAPLASPATPISPSPPSPRAYPTDSSAISDLADALEHKYAGHAGGKHATAVTADALWEIASSPTVAAPRAGLAVATMRAPPRAAPKLSTFMPPRAASGSSVPGAAQMADKQKTYHL